MAWRTVNLHDVVILVAAHNPHASRVTQGILRGLGANRVLAAETSTAVLQTLAERKVDVLLCDEKLPELGGTGLTRVIRRTTDGENRTIPILVMCSRTREATVKAVRDAGANMAIAKPMSARSLYERLAWVAFSPRPFVDTNTYFGPDRRFKNIGCPGGIPRRRTDRAAAEAVAGAPPAPDQVDIDTLFGTGAGS